MYETARTVGAESGMLEPSGVVLLRIIPALMSATALGAKLGRFHDHLRRRQHVVEFAGLDGLIYAAGCGVIGCRAREAAKRVFACRQRVLVPPQPCRPQHDMAHFLLDVVDAGMALLVSAVRDLPHRRGDDGLPIARSRRKHSGGRAPAGERTEHEGVGAAIAGEAARSVHATRALAAGIKAGNPGPALLVDQHAAHL